MQILQMSGKPIIFVTQMLPVIVRCANNLCNFLEEYAESGADFDIKRYFVSDLSNNIVIIEKNKKMFRL